MLRLRLSQGRGRGPRSLRRVAGRAGAQHFARVILFDMRFVRRQLILDSFDLDGNKVLFLYNTSVLNTDP